MNTHRSLGHVGQKYGQSVYFSLCPVCHRSAASPSSNSLKCFPSVLVDFPVREGFSSLERGFPRIRESLLCFSSHALGCRSHSASSPPPSPFLFPILPSYAGIFIVLSGVQGLLLVFSRCSVRIVASIDVFLMHPWREMNSTSTDSSAILNLRDCFLKREGKCMHLHKTS